MPCWAWLRQSLAFGRWVGGQCKTDVIGDVTPFAFTSPYPFFLDDDYKVNGTYTISSSDAGQVRGCSLTILTRGAVTPCHTPQPTCNEINEN